MQKAFRLLGVVLVGFAFSSTAYASVLYDNSTTGANVTLATSTSFQIQNQTTFSSAPYPLITTTTGTVAYIRFKMVSGSTDICTVGALYVYKTTTGNYAGGTGVVSGSYCTFPIAIPSSISIGNIFVFGFGGTSHVLVGSANFSTFDGSSVRQGNGLAFQLCDSGGCSGGFSPPVDGIMSTSAPTASTYLSNPIPFAGTYNNGVNHAYDQIVFDLNNTTQGFETSIVKPTTLTSGSGIAYSFSQNLPLEGNWSYNVKLYDSLNATSTAWFAGNSFAVGTTTATSTPVFNAPALVCDTWDLACYVKKAFIWLIYPTDSLASSYNGFLTTIQSRAPIGYFAILIDDLRGINSTSTPSMALVIPAHIQTIIFNPFDIAIASILWFYFAVHFYRRLKHIQL